MLPLASLKAVSNTIQIYKKCKNLVFNKKRHLCHNCDNKPHTTKYAHSEKGKEKAKTRLKKHKAIKKVWNSRNMYTCVHLESN